MERWLAVSPMASTMERVERVEAVDDYTVRFVLSEPLAPLPYLLAAETAQAVIMPKELAEGAGPGALTEFIGTGPYRLVEWVTDRSITLDRFEDYAARDEDWGGVAGRKDAYLDTIVFRSIPESEVRLAGLETGEFQASQPLPADYFDALERAPNAEPVIVEFDLKPVIYFSMEGIMSDPLMRKAIRAAIDAEEVMFAATGDERFYDLNPDQLWYRFQAFWSDTGAEVYNQADPELAMQLAREEGYDGQPIRFLASSTQYHHRQPAIIIAEQLQDAGFNITFDLRDWPTVSQLQNTDPTAWDFTYIRTGLMMPSEIEFVRLFGFDSPETQEALEVIFEEVEFEALFEAMEEFKREVIVEQVPWYTFGDMFALRGVTTDVRGLQDLYSHPLWGVWLE
jgi:peptide/nickel transport system substrate-binding protein